MKIAFFSVHAFEKPFLIAANERYGHDLHFFESRLTSETAQLTKSFEAVSCFVTDELNKAAIDKLAKEDVKLIALRTAGFNHVDIRAAKEKGICVLRVPAYSPHAVAEFTVGMILTLNRKIHRAYYRVRENNFSLDGLMGFELYGKTVGIIGTGKIGAIFAKIMHGFGCKLLAHDPIHNPDCEKLGVHYVGLDELYQLSDIISLHCPLLRETEHIINAKAIEKMKPHVMIINTGRGKLLDTAAVIHALKRQKIGYLGIDVYEEEENLFFEDLSETIIQDDVFARLQTFPNVLITGHQAFFTEKAVTNIAETTLKNIHDFSNGLIASENQV